MDIYSLIKPELLILIPVLYFIGVGLKKSKLKDNMIPMCIGVVSVILSLTWVISTSEIRSVRDVVLAIFTGVTQGVLTAGSSVYFNQLYKQYCKAKKENDSK